MSTIVRASRTSINRTEQLRQALQSTATEVIDAEIVDDEQELVLEAVRQNTQRSGLNTTRYLTVAEHHNLQANLWGWRLVWLGAISVIGLLGYLVVGSFQVAIERARHPDPPSQICVPIGGRCEFQESQPQ